MIDSNALLFPDENPGKYVLGSCIENLSKSSAEFHTCYHRGVRPEMFDPLDRLVWESIEDAVGNGQKIDWQTIKTFSKPKFESEKHFDFYFCGFETMGAYTLNVEYFADELVKGWQQRWLDDQLRNLPNSIDRKQKFYELTEQLQSMTVAGIQDNSIPTVADDMVEHIEAIIAGEKQPSIRTGFRTIDESLSIQDGSLTILAARPSGGKTTMGCHLAVQAIYSGKHVLFYTVEMLARDILQRMVCLVANIDSRKVARGLMSEDELNRFVQGTRELARSNKNQIVHGNGDFSILQALARRSRKEGKLDALFVDYLGLIKADKKNFKNSYEEVSYIVEAHKALAMELEIPIVLLCQLRRAQQGKEHIPANESDLRDSGKIEQAADNVIILHVPYENNEPIHTSRQFFLRKNRQGPKDIHVYLNCNLASGRIWE